MQLFQVITSLSVVTKKYQNRKVNNLKEVKVKKTRNRSIFKFLIVIKIVIKNKNCYM